MRHVSLNFLFVYCNVEYTKKCYIQCFFFFSCFFLLFCVYYYRIFLFGCVCVGVGVFDAVVSCVSVIYIPLYSLRFYGAEKLFRFVETNRCRHSWMLCVCYLDEAKATIQCAVCSVWSRVLVVIGLRLVTLLHCLFIFFCLSHGVLSDCYYFSLLFFFCFRFFELKIKKTWKEKQKKKRTEYK